MTKEQGREILAKITDGLTETDICSVMLTPKQTLSIAEYVEAIEKERDELRAAQPEQEPVAWVRPRTLEWYAAGPSETKSDVSSIDMAIKPFGEYVAPLYASPPAPAGDAVREIRRKAFAEAAEIAANAFKCRTCGEVTVKLGHCCDRPDYDGPTRQAIAAAIRSRAEG